MTNSAMARGNEDFFSSASNVGVPVKVGSGDNSEPAPPATAVEVLSALPMDELAT